jgi:murein DD-endopeptidase MepM/ murein hydrolase activator NlpD
MKRIFGAAAAVLALGAGVLHAAPRKPPELRFAVSPSTVTAGRTLSFLCYSDQDIQRPAVFFRKRRAPLFKIGENVWRGLVGIGPTEEPGRKDLLFYAEWSRGQVVQSTAVFYVAAGDYPLRRLKLPKKAAALVESGEMRHDAAYLSQIYTDVYTSSKNWNGPFLWPTTGTVTSIFGARRAYGKSAVYLSHTGVDIASHTGTAIVAPAAGAVVYSGWLNSFGHSVVLDHGQGVFTYYLHMSSAAVRGGEFLNAGDPVGSMGALGVATGPHLHWSMAVAGERVDPLEWTERPVE